MSKDERITNLAKILHKISEDYIKAEKLLDSAILHKDTLGQTYIKNVRLPHLVGEYAEYNADYLMLTGLQYNYYSH